MCAPAGAQNRQQDNEDNDKSWQSPEVVINVLTTFSSRLGYL